MDLAGGLDAREHASRIGGATTTERRSGDSRCASAHVARDASARGGGSGTLDRDAVRGAHPGLRGPVRPPAPPDPQAGGRALGGLARPRSSTRTSPSSTACERRSTSTSPPSSCSSRRRWWSSRRAACCPGLDDLELDEELLRFEERDLLLARLLECKTFKDAAPALEARMRRADRSLPRTRRAPRSRTARWRPTRSSGCGPTRCAPPRCAMLAAKPGADRRHRARRAGPRQRARRGRDGAAPAARARADELPRARRRACRTGSR